MQSEYKTESRGVSGRTFDITYNGLYPRLIGFITKQGRSWMAERGPINLGKFKTRLQARKAIIAEFERPHTEDNPIPLSLMDSGCSCDRCMYG